MARQALERPDLGIAAAHLFPVEANWGPKSESVRRILAAWNIAADSVVFIDDSPMELAEVAAAHPGLETIAFPKDPDALLAMLWMLRDRFGKHAITEEDRLRGASLRTAAGQWNQAAGVGGAGAEDFLAGAEAVVTFDGSNPPADGRALELVNKTNQFNLDGRRWTDSEWSALLARPGAFVAVVSYRDRFGPLGRIGVLAGQRQAGRRNDPRPGVRPCRAAAGGGTEAHDQGGRLRIPAVLRFLSVQPGSHLQIHQPVDQP